MANSPFKLPIASTNDADMAAYAKAAMQPSKPANDMTAVETLAERDKQHAPVDRAKRALGLPK